MEEYSKGYKKILLIISLLCLNIVEGAASVISCTIPAMAQAFPGQSQVHIELLTTVVSVFVTIFVLVSGFLTNKIGQKNTAILGIIIATASSIIPVFSNSFFVIMISRAILGIGIGLANPLAISLIGEFFEGDLLANLMGWRTAVAGVGVSLMTMFAGQLLKISWHASYLVYLLFIPTLLLFIFFVPSPEKYGIHHNTNEQDNTDNKQEVENVEAHAQIKVFGYALLLFAFFSCAMVPMIKLAIMYIENGIGTPAETSIIFAVLQFSQLIGGFIFGTAYKHLHSKVLPLGLLLTGITTIGMALSPNSSIILIMAIITGFAGGIAVPYIFTRISQLSVTKTAPLNNALALVGSNMGSFIAPYFACILGTKAADVILHTGILLIIVSIVVIIAFIFSKQHHTQVSPAMK